MTKRKGKEYVIEEGNSSRDFGLGNISNLSVGASYTFLKDLSVLLWKTLFERFFELIFLLFR